MTLRIAMWSGPRNLSTAMMYAFGNRGGCTAIDEPFYAAYLAKTGLDHPMRDAILKSQPNNINDAIQALTKPKQLQYEKHMTHHLLPEFPRDWIKDVDNVYLIRHPARVIASYQAKRENPTLADLGFEQQLSLYQEFGGTIIDSADVLATPRDMMGVLCDELGMCFDPGMVSWPKGPKPFDGVWAPHWYNAVHQSTGFTKEEGPLPELTGDALALCRQAMPYFEALSEMKVH